MTATTTHDSENSERQALLVSKVKAYVKDFMKNYDGSHDFAHIQRVLGLALTIANSSPAPCDLHIVTLAALLHDVGDRKYLQPLDDPTTMVEKVLLGFGADKVLAHTVQAITTAVSYTHEIKNPKLVHELVLRYPELATVQDADRLDAIGAIGIGRVFTYGGAHGGRHMEESMSLFEIKLEKLEGMMKTEKGKELAAERTQRLLLFKEWWADELETGRVALDSMQA